MVKWIQDILLRGLTLQLSPGSSPYPQASLTLSFPWPQRAHLQSSVGDYPKSLHLRYAVIAFVQIHVQRPGLQDVLLAFPGRKRLRLHPDQFKEVQHGLGKKEAEEVMV